MVCLDVFVLWIVLGLYCGVLVEMAVVYLVVVI